MSIFLAILSLLAGCSKENSPPEEQPPITVDTVPVIDTSSGLPLGTTFIPSSPQRTTGDAELGYNYLLYGDYVGAGIPYDLFVQINPFEGENLLQRTGDNANLPFSFNAFNAPNGVRVVGGLNCFGCHAASIDGKFIAGLGNSFSDFTMNNSLTFGFADLAVKQQYGENSPEYESFLPYFRGGIAAAEHIEMPFAGINPAFVLEKGAVRFRHPQSLEWQEQPVFDMPGPFIGSDVPPLWNVKKKNALYYTGLGKGDYSKLLMQVMLVAIEDSSQANQILENFDDVLAWITALQPPEFPLSMDSDLAIKGKEVFSIHCQSCHGSYGDEEEYPNLFVQIDRVQTDDVYALSFTNHTQFEDWFSQSWFGNEPFIARSEAQVGYVAPPLDGIWATAPYLHNGSIPTLYDLLKSSERPRFWRRSFQSNDYNFDLVGWNYERLSAASDTRTYDTTVPGYGNQGHLFGDNLSEEDRLSLLEYLKTL